MWELMSSYIGTNKQSIQRSIVNHVEYTLARTRFNFDNMGAYQATAYSVRDRLLEAWNDTQQYHTVSNRSSLSLLQMEEDPSLVCLWKLSNSLLCCLFASKLFSLSD